MYTYELKIPKERVAVLIGKKGTIKKKLETKTKTKLDIGSEGDVIIQCEDNLNSLLAQNIIKAIGRGFNPEIAELLLDENNLLEIINIIGFTGKSKKKFTRIKARLIGTQGKSRKLIEHMTNTEISIYGKTVSIIGYFDNVLLAKKALEHLLSGAPHGNVYSFIENQKKENKKREFEQNA